MKKRNNINISTLIIVGALFCFVVLIARTAFLGLSNEIDGIDIKQFAENRSILSKTIPAHRGTIFDINGDILAQNVASYTLIAYIDPIRSEGEKKLYHVADKEMTAQKLSTVIDMSYEKIKAILSQEDLYQVEFGSAGRGLTQLEKEAIESLNLPGIDFMESEKRYYPNGDFASYAIGYAKKNEENLIEGELGIESLLNENLSGTDGFISYQKDVNGYQIPGTDAIEIDAEDGYDIYLTIDSNVQFFVEQAINQSYDNYKSDWMVIVVADAKTGAILASSQRPSYDPNVLDIKNYLDLTVADPYEPGSIMKIYTYMAAMEAGTYDGNQTFKSGSYAVDANTTISDWSKAGFGTITFDQGFQASSNVGVINIINRFINKTILDDYFKKMGFGKKTGITLANEQAGKIKFTYKTEIYSAGFGQGILTTPMQHIQALTSIANDGIMLQPYIIDKIADDKGKVVYQSEKNSLGRVASEETTDKIKELMYQTVNSNWSTATGRSYKMNGYDLIGKTGTSQLVNNATGKYYSGDYNSIRSFVGMWPKEDPEIIIYMSVKKSVSGSKPLTQAVKNIVKNVSKYYNIFNSTEDQTIENYTVSSYINKTTNETKTILDDNEVNYEIIGDGNKIINQYPEKNSIISSNEKIILITSGTNYKMPNIVGYSKKEARALCDMLKLECTFSGYGYVDTQSIIATTAIKEKDKLVINLKEIYKTN